ncbi:MAG: polyprenyl synthetase family protein [Leptospiraceae bacterium]|nr:polyprenyl synthetase family protein [Leptospiraceae bacterium]MCP5493710.1 polyprenyl synthetase family protein [Leptospiraceae bacterium]
MSNINLPIIIKKFDNHLGKIIQEDLKILKDIKRYIIKSGGKRIRPLTHYFITQLLNYKGKDWLDIGSISELIHAASLLHDDVVDNSELRRGSPTIGKLYGNKVAILAGDYLLACGIEHLNKFQNPRLMDSFTKVIRDLAVGELLQMEWEKNPSISRVEYNKIIYGKTASLFGAVSETAGILAKADEKKIQELKNFGVSLGMMFQVKDDYIDYFQEEKKTGKTRMKDFLNGLYTYPLIRLKELASKKEVKEIDFIISKPSRNQEDIHKTLELTQKYSTQKEILNELKDFAYQLKTFLNQFPKSQYRNLMLERIEQLVES